MRECSLEQAAPFWLCGVANERRLLARIILQIE
jgi:hypothetical protein